MGTNTGDEDSSSIVAALGFTPASVAFAVKAAQDSAMKYDTTGHGAINAAIALKAVKAHTDSMHVADSTLAAGKQKNIVCSGCTKGVGTASDTIKVAFASAWAPRWPRRRPRSPASAASSR